ncbi:uncharacterized protein LOC132554700 [Ylistrum balloti]|uniref:uncharacterized protein LOC132554700 n=1 Tax=Ylistrum balloti TaxID=509963 RepID=UPI002905EBD1|nr:uncharacterized protein LOC132554700 [Ylistrum balloti]
MEKASVQLLFIGLTMCRYASAYISMYCGKLDGTDMKVYCRYGCCGTNFTMPCCVSEDDDSPSIPPFSIFFYALTVFILFLLIVCCVGRVARLKSRRPSTTPSSGRPFSRPNSQRISTDLSRTLVIATIENFIRVGRQSSNVDHNTEEPNPSITDFSLSPPSYDDAIKTAPPEQPPSYFDAMNEDIAPPRPPPDTDE